MIIQKQVFYASIMKVKGLLFEHSIPDLIHPLLLEEPPLICEDISLDFVAWLWGFAYAATRELVRSDVQ